jgi:hypothetical protein
MGSVVTVATLHPANALENTPSSMDLHYRPSHLRDCPAGDRFLVSKEMQKQFTPFYVGWKKPSWVVVIRGRDTGIFHDYWYVFRVVYSKFKCETVYIVSRGRIWPLIKYTEKTIIPGASWQKAESEVDAFSKWESAVEEGVTGRII